MRRLLMVVLAEVGAVALTQRLAQPHWAALHRDPAGLVDAPAGDLVLSVVHLAAWLSAWWLLLGTGHDLLAVVGELRHGRRARGPRLAPRWVQRILHRAVGTVLVMGVVAGPASAATGATPTRPAEVGQVVAPPVPIVGLPAGDGAAGQSAVATDQPPSATDQPDAQGDVQTDAEDGVHVVAAGENLWVIARQHLVAASAQPPSDRDVHAHWIRLIQANAGGLRSGDPDRIFPGERLRLPQPADPEAAAAGAPTHDTQDGDAATTGEDAP